MSPHTVNMHFCPLSHSYINAMSTVGLPVSLIPSVCVCIYSIVGLLLSLVHSVCVCVCVCIVALPVSLVHSVSVCVAL